MELTVTNEPKTTIGIKRPITTIDEVEQTSTKEFKRGKKKNNKEDTAMELVEQNSNKQLTVEEQPKVDKKKGKQFQTKCRPKKLVELIKNLNEEQQKAVRDIGFGGLLELKITQLPHGILNRVLKAFDCTSNMFRTKKRDFLLSKHDVHDIFLLPRIGNKVNCARRGNTKMKNDWRLKFGVKCTSAPINVKNVHKRLMGCTEADDEFKRMFVLYSMSIFLAPTTNKTLDLKLVKSVVDVTKIRDYDWCDYIFEEMTASIQGWKEKKKANITGCLLVVMLAYFHRFDFKGKVVKHTLPLIQHWDDVELTKRVDDEKKTAFLGNAPISEIEYPICLRQQEEPEMRLTQTSEKDEHEAEPEAKEGYIMIKLPKGVETDKQIRVRAMDSAHEIYLRIKRDNELFFSRYAYNMRKFINMKPANTMDETTISTQVAAMKDCRKEDDTEKEAAEGEVDNCDTSEKQDQDTPKTQTTFMKDIGYHIFTDGLIARSYERLEAKQGLPSFDVLAEMLKIQYKELNKEYGGCTYPDLQMSSDNDEQDEEINDITNLNSADGEKKDDEQDNDMYSNLNEVVDNIGLGERWAGEEEFNEDLNHDTAHRGDIEGESEKINEDTNVLTQLNDGVSNVGLGVMEAVSNVDLGVTNVGLDGSIIDYLLHSDTIADIDIVLQRAEDVPKLNCGGGGGGGEGTKGDELMKAIEEGENLEGVVDYNESSEHVLANIDITKSIVLERVEDVPKPNCDAGGGGGEGRAEIVIIQGGGGETNSGEAELVKGVEGVGGGGGGGELVKGVDEGVGGGGGKAKLVKRVEVVDKEIVQEGDHEMVQEQGPGKADVGAIPVQGGSIKGQGSGPCETPYAPHTNLIYHPFLLHSSEPLPCMNVVPHNLGCSIDCGEPNPELNFVSHNLQSNKNLYDTVFSRRKEVMDYIFNGSNTYQKWEQLVMYNDFFFVSRADVLMLQPGNEIMTSVIDCWCLLLNHMMNANTAPSRCFMGLSHTSAMLEIWMAQKNGKVLDKTQEIFSLWDVWAKSGVAPFQLDSDMVFIPVLSQDHDHYSCACINFLTQHIEYLDNRSYDEDLEKLPYGGIARIGVDIMGKYMVSKGLSKGRKVSGFKLVNVEFKWQCTGYTEKDSGVYLMIHMLLYCGNPFECGLGKMDAINLCRAEIGATLVLSDINKVREDILLRVSNFKEVNAHPLTRRLNDAALKRKSGSDIGVTYTKRLRLSSPKGEHNQRLFAGLGCSLDCVSLECVSVDCGSAIVVSKFLLNNQTLLEEVKPLRKHVVDYCFKSNYSFSPMEDLVVFGHHARLWRRDVMSMLPDTLMSPNVIESWSVLLNRTRTESAENKFSRMSFFGMRHMEFVMRLLQLSKHGSESDLDGVKCKMFKVWDTFIENSNETFNLNADLLFIPLNVSNHYACVCINFKAETIDLLDHKHHPNWDRSNVCKAARLIAFSMEEYLDSRGVAREGHISHFEQRQIAASKRKVNVEESGIFTMMHMLMYEGAPFDHRDVLKKVNRHYLVVELAAALVLADINVERGSLLKKVDSFVVTNLGRSSKYAIKPVPESKS